MTITDDYNFGTISTVLDNMTDEDFESLLIDKYTDKYKNNPDLM